MVQRLEVSPAQVSLGPGGWFALSATAIFSDGSLRDVTGLAGWSAADPGFLAAGNGLQAGQGLALDGGTTQLFATFGSVTASATVAISPAAQVPLLEVWPPLLQLHAGTFQSLSATAVWPGGDALDVTAWTVFASSNASVASVSNATGRRGQLAALNAGNAGLTAFFAQATATASVAVDAMTADSLAVSGPSSLPVGQPAMLQALAHFHDGSLVDVTSQSAFTSSAPSVLRVRGTGAERGTAIALSPGAANAQARFLGATGATAFSTTPGGAQALSIVGLPSSVPAGVQMHLIAVASFPGGIQQDVTSRAVWTSSAPEVASIASGQAGGTLRAVAPGAAQLTASFAGTTASTAVNISAALLSGLTILPAAATGAVGVEVPLRAQGTFSDGSQLDLTAQTRWASANPSLVAISNGAQTRGAAMALAEGTTGVTALVTRPDGTVVSTSATFLGAAALPVGVDVTPQPVTLSLASQVTLPLQARVLLSDGTTRDVSSAATWSVLAPGVAQVTSAGVLTAVATGTTTVSATYGSVIGTAEVTVIP